MKKYYLYIEDFQMYYNSVYKFSCEKEIPKEILNECASDNGRLSQSFNTFAYKLRLKEYTIKPEHISESELLSGFKVLDIVRGCEGNY